MKKISEIKKQWLFEQIESLKNKGVHKAEISRLLDIKPQYLNSITNGERNITDQFIDKFVEIFNVNQIDLFETHSSFCPNCKEKDEHLLTQRKLISRLEDENESLKAELDCKTHIKKVAQGD